MGQSPWPLQNGKTSHRATTAALTSPVHFAPYRAGPKRREFEKAEIDRMLSENVIAPAQVERAAHIVFIPEKD